MNKKIFSLVVSGLIFSAGLLTGAKDAQAETLLEDFLKEKGVEIEVSAAVDFYSKYVWRGFLLDDDHVVQPSVTLSLNGFEGGFWGSWDIQGDDALTSDEVDGWIGYGFDCAFLGDSWKKLSFSLGHTWYDFPKADLYTKELYLGLAVDTFLSPYITWYHDYDEEAHGGADGNYIMAGIGHSITLNEKYGIGLDLGLEYGYNDNAFIDGNGSYVLSKAGLNLPLSEKITVTPSIGYSVPFDDLESGGGNDQEEQFYGGVSLSMAF